MSRTKTMLEELKRLDQMIPSAAEMTAHEYLCPDGRAQIDVNLFDGAELFNPLTYQKQRDLNSAIYELIDEKLYTIPLKYPVRICFHGHLPDEGTQQEVCGIIQEHYMYALRDKKEDLRLNRLKTICLALFGVVLLTLYFALELLASNPVFMELLSIAGWVAAWEAVDSWFLERKSIKLEYLSAGQAVLAEVSFSDDGNPLSQA
ncbi:MAG: hypothetical protein Q4C35_02670 [Eubacteriales bacterium]|nr:hypothetical protein [Eubacteriales bacterium]